jgi:PEP-CTERM/exosortase A-associated glycosyltransferase
VVLTSAHHEIEVGRTGDVSGPEVIDGVSYYRTPRPGGLPGNFSLKTPLLRERALMSALAKSLERTLAAEPVDVIHAHSPILCGRPALAAARQRGLPVVYEVRAFWEDAYLLGPTTSRVAKAKYRASHALETSLFRKVDAVVAISTHMVDDIVGRGIDRARVYCMPNGVDSEKFVPVATDAALAARLGVSPGATVGFIGTMLDIEGIECLVRAMPAVRARVPAAKLVIVGSGPQDGPVRELVGQLGLQDLVVLTGRVPHEEIQRYYSIMDVLVYPRARFRVTELVTPLKPLEAMALGRVVVGSDVGGITELLDRGRVGVLFKAGDDRDLADKLVSLLQDPERRAALAEEGRRYVLRERTWGAIVPRYVPLYDALLGRGARRPA